MPRPTPSITVPESVKVTLVALMARMFIDPSGYEPSPGLLLASSAASGAESNAWTSSRGTVVPGTTSAGGSANLTFHHTVASQLGVTLGSPQPEG